LPAGGASDTSSVFFALPEAGNNEAEGDLLNKWTRAPNRTTARPRKKTGAYEDEANMPVDPSRE